MDGHQFDDLLRTVARSRRAAIVTLVGAAAGMAGLPDTAAGKKRKKKKKKCNGCSVCQKCVKGKCRPLPDRTACGGVCQECMGGQCVNKAAGETCGGTNQCLNGVCNVRPDCIKAITVSGCTLIPNCCSGNCDTAAFAGAGQCLTGAAGTPCTTASDCTSTQCVGYRCL